MNSLLKFQNKVSVETIYKCAILKVNTYISAIIIGLVLQMSVHSVSLWQA